MYTRNQLREDLQTINGKLSKLQPGYHLEAQGRNGYTGLDLYNGESCERTLQCGTPRECLSAANQYLVSNI